jgi:uncharacterized membrane protein
MQPGRHVSPLHFTLVYGAVLVAMLLLDVLWLGVIAVDWYTEAIGHLMADTPYLPAALVFYLLYPLGIVIFGVRPHEALTVTRSARWGALFGLFAYATYDLTNLATLNDWPVAISLLDIGWGTLLGAVTAAVGRVACDKLVVST